jgi:TolB protein
MMMMTRCLLFLMVCMGLVFSLHSEEDEQEIKIYLSTTNPLTPLYVADWQSASSSLDATYAAKLFEILKYDLAHSGFSSLLTRDSFMEDLLKNSDKQVAFSPTTWKEKGAAHVVLGKITDHSLVISLFSIQARTLKHLPQINLTGNFQTDRLQIHRLTDTLNKVLYGMEGMAHSKMLYCLQKPSPSGKKNQWISEVWECDWDGANAKQITYENSYCVTPIFLPSDHHSSDRFVYVSYKKGQPKIYISSLQEGKGNRLIDLRGNQLLPAISRQRDKIAYICDASGRTDLFVQHLNPTTGRADTPQQLFSYPRSTQASPTFSPAGDKIAFVSDKDGSAKIYIIPAKPGPCRHTPLLISKKNQENSCPAWSPDGTKIAYSAKTKGVRQIWIYDFATGEERQLTDGPNHKENPAWAPNSLHLVFNSISGDSSDLFVVNLNQPEAIKITSGPGKKTYPAWGTR